MKVSQTLWRQHIGRMTRKNWLVARTRTPVATTTENYLKSIGINVEDALEVIKPKIPLEKYEVPEQLIKKIQYDETHPDWKQRRCLVYNDNNVLQNGVKQAQLLTNTIQLENKLPQKIYNLMENLSENIDNLVQRAIRVSNIYDAHQEKLPKIKDPLRPAWNFPRSYGLTVPRKSKSLALKLVHISELFAPKELVMKRALLVDKITSSCIERESDLLRFHLTMDLMLTSSDVLEPIENPEKSREYELPSLYPMHHIIGIPVTNIYQNDTIYPVSPVLPQVNVHTIFMHFNGDATKNITELPVTEDQIIARSLINSFTAAMTCAKVKFGEKPGKLPHPITVQCVQSYEGNFHFSVYQLNTLDLDDTEGIKNFWWNEPILKFFEEAGYVNGRPTLTGYNAEVFKRIRAFYSNT